MNQYVKNEKIIGAPRDNEERKRYYDSILLHLAGAYVCVVNGGGFKPRDLPKEVVERILMPMTGHLMYCGGRWNEEAIEIFKAQNFDNVNSQTSKKQLILSELTNYRETIFKSKMFIQYKYELLRPHMSEVVPYSSLYKESVIKNHLSEYNDSLKMIGIGPKRVSSPPGFLEIMEKAIRFYTWREFGEAGPFTHLFKRKISEVHFQNTFLMRFANMHGLRKPSNDDNAVFKQFFDRYLDKRLEDKITRIFYERHYTPVHIADVIINSTKFNLSDLFDELVPIGHLDGIEPLFVDEDFQIDHDTIQKDEHGLNEAFDQFFETYSGYQNGIKSKDELRSWFEDKEKDQKCVEAFTGCGHFASSYIYENDKYTQQFAVPKCLAMKTVCLKLNRKEDELAIRATAKQKGDRWVAMKIFEVVGVLKTTMTFVKRYYIFEMDVHFMCLTHIILTCMFH